MLGWANTSAIDHALRSIDLAKEHRAQLVLCGHGDLVPLAYGLHRRAFATAAPFIVCDPHRGNTAASVRSPANYVEAAAAFEAAAGGSLCIRRRRPPHDFPSLVARLRDSNNVQYICLDEDAAQWLVRPGPIEVPPLAQRVSELPRIVDEYMFDAVIELAPMPGTLALTERDRAWLIESAAAKSLSEIEKAALRLVALRSTANVSRAAARLGMAAVSLSRWVERRKLPAAHDVASAA
ncbi:MAG: hypothetical protein ABIY55_35430 [Kofleriaceae bacterium]